MLPKLLVVTPFPTTHKPIKSLRPESSENHVITLIKRRIMWIITCISTNTYIGRKGELALKVSNKKTYLSSRHYVLMLLCLKNWSFCSFVYIKNSRSTNKLKASFPLSVLA